MALHHTELHHTSGKHRGGDCACNQSLDNAPPALYMGRLWSRCQSACACKHSVTCVRLSAVNAQVMALLLGGWMALQGDISGQQLTSFVLYTEFVMSASLSVCDQWGGVMEAIGASERVIEYLDHPPAPQIQPGTVPDSFSGQVMPRSLRRNGKLLWPLELLCKARLGRRVPVM